MLIQVGTLSSKAHIGFRPEEDFSFLLSSLQGVMGLWKVSNRAGRTCEDEFDDEVDEPQAQDKGHAAPLGRLKYAACLQKTTSVMQASYTIH